MAGMNAEANRRPGSAKKVISGTAAIEPAIDASVERAAIERDPASAIDPATSTPVIPAADLPAPDATVVPEPTLIAEPGLPQPIVTASPPLAAEPSAVDVQNAAATADRVAAGMEPAVDPDGPQPTAAGQTMLTFDDGVRRDRTIAATKADLGGREDHTTPAPPIDAIIAGLEHLSRTDPIGMEIIRTGYFADGPRDALERRADTFAKPRTVTVYEVVGPAGGRRRAGRLFGPQPQRFAAYELTSADIAALRSDPLLAVGTSEVEADAFGYPIYDV